MADKIVTDVLVVGAGPAGSTVARYAAESGLDVTMIERRSKVGVPVRCGEFIPCTDEIAAMFPESEGLAELFDLPSSLVRRELEAIRLVTPSTRSYDLPFIGYSTDRDRFDQHLASEAVSAGAQLITGCAFQTVDDDSYITSEGRIKAKVIVGADGPGSRVAQEMGLPLPRNAYPAVTAQAKGDFEPVLVMYFGGIAPGAYGWIIPKDGSANVGVGYSPKLADRTPAEYFRSFSEKHGFDVQTRLSGKHVPAQGPLNRITGEDYLTVGDAAGHVMAVNGGGVPLAMIGGKLAADAIFEHIRNDAPLLRYENDCRKVLFPPLKSAARTKQMADIFAFGSDFRTEICMRILGRRRMAKMLRCRFPFP